MDQYTEENLHRKDRQYVWHPFTQMKDYETRDHLLIEKAEGIHLYDASGNRYYDTVSSWWVNLHGHSHPRLRAALSKQMEQLDHVMFSGITHRPAIELAEKLVEITPDGLNKVFYSDNGSTAIEVALKMSFQYWQHLGKKEKVRFAYLEHSYHGDTLGAVSVGGVDLFHSMFKPLLFNAYKLPSPHIHEWPDSTPEGERQCVAYCLEEVRRLFAASAGQIAAFVVEPMIQAAGGMIMYPAAYLTGLKQLCVQYNVHLIADEVAVGFGRTGRMFGCDHAGITPDMMCLSKGLTAGVMPLSATLCTDELYAAFYDDYNTMKTFFHGHSYTGNPLSCAIALESLRIFADEAVMDHVTEAAAHLAAKAAQLSELQHVGNMRTLGMVAAFELYRDKRTKQSYNTAERMGYHVYLEGLQEGLILRPLGDTIYYWLPLCTTLQQIDDIVARTMRVLQRLKLT